MKKELIKPVVLKQARSKKQVEDICKYIEDWSCANKIVFKTEFRENQLGYKIVAGEFDGEFFLEQCGLMIGECMHNLRSSLDNLAFALACLKQNPPPNPKKISFPIYANHDEFIKQAKTKLVAQLPTQAADLIEKLQPFQRLSPDVDGSPDTDPLIHLQWFNNIDKHQIPTAVLLSPNGDIQSNCSVLFASEEDARLNVPPQIEFFGYPLKSGSTVMEHKTNRPVQSVQADFTLAAIVGIQCMDSIKPAHVILQELHHYVTLVTDQFRSYFEEA